MYAGTAQQELQQIAQSAMLEGRHLGQYEKDRRTSRAVTTPTSRSVSMTSSYYSLNPVIDVRSRW